jgi:hypothetical protein
MSDRSPLFDVRRYTLTLIISFIVVVVFGLLMMLWHGSYEKDANGKVHYNTRVNEPSSDY